MEHGHLLCTLFIARDDRDIIELLYTGPAALGIEVHIAFIINIIGRDLRRCTSQTHGGNGHFCSLTQTLQGFGVGGIDGSKSILSIATLHRPLLQIGSDHFVTILAQALQYFSTQIAEGTSQNNFHFHFLLVSSALELNFRFQYSLHSDKSQGFSAVHSRCTDLRGMLDFFVDVYYND